MGDEHDARARLGGDPQQLRLHVLTGHLVEGPERLVHQQQLRRGGQRPGNRHPLLHSAGQLPRSVTGELVELDELEHLHRPRAPPRPIPTLQLERQLDVTDDGPPVEETSLLKRHPVVLVDAGLTGRLAVDHDRPCSRFGEVGDQPQQRRLATAGRPDQ